MTNDQFMFEVEKAYQSSCKLLQEKGKEYSSGNSRLDQFYRAGHVQGISPTQALLGMATKHYTSICDMAKNPSAYSMAQWRAKLDDLRNYTFLLDALLTDMRS